MAVVWKFLAIEVVRKRGSKSELFIAKVPLRLLVCLSSETLLTENEQTIKVKEGFASRDEPKLIAFFGKFVLLKILSELHPKRLLYHNKTLYRYVDERYQTCSYVDLWVFEYW